MSVDRETVRPWPSCRGRQASAARRLSELGATRRPLVGLNVGAGSVFPGKRWAAAKITELAERLLAKTDATIVLLGGPEEVARNAEIRTALGGRCVDLGTNNPLRLICGLGTYLIGFVLAGALVRAGLNGAGGAQP